MTFDDWKTALLPLGWVDRGTHLTSPEDSCGGRVGLHKHSGSDDCYIVIIPYPAVPPDLDTMRALMQGLQIPMTTKEGE